MGSALAKGLLRSGVKKNTLALSDTERGNAHAVKNADIVFIAVKPRVVGEVLGGIAGVSKEQAIVSLAAGISLRELQHSFGRKNGIARIMPNMPVSVGQGVIGFYKGTLSAQDTKNIRTLLEGLGIVIEVTNEKSLDVFTAISGSGPAVAAYCIEALAMSAKKLGIEEDTARAAAFGVFAGTSAYLAESKLSPAELMKSVATKGGVTETILKSFQTEQVGKRIEKGIQAGFAKVKKIKA